MLWTGVPTLGPSGVSVPGTLAAYFTSLNKAKYSIFDQGAGKFQTSAGTGAVNSGDPVGCWLAAYQLGETWKFQQATSASRPTFSTNQFPDPGIYGNGTSHCLEADSTTALDRAVTVLVLYNWANTTGMVWSQNGQTFGVRHSAANAAATFLENGSAIEGQGFSTGGGDYNYVSAATRRYRVGASAGVARIAAAFNSSEPVRTSRYGNKLFVLSGGASLFFAVAAAVRTNLAAELARIDVATSSRAAPGAAMALTGGERTTLMESLAVPTADDNAGAAATAILANPTHKLATDASGFVTATNGGGGSGTNYIIPLRAVTGERMIPGRIEMFLQELLASTLPILDESGSPVDCTGKTANLLVRVGATVIKLPNLTPTGSPPHRYAFTPSSGMTAVPGGHEFTLERADSSKEVLSWGTFQVISCVREA